MGHWPCRPGARPRLLVVRVTPVEVAAALFRRVRGGTLTLTAASSALAMLANNMQRTFQVAEVTPTLADLAIEIAERYGLRGYDCIQLAGALLTQRQRARSGLNPLTLVSADAELNSAARAEGLPVEDPNAHP